MTKDKEKKIKAYKIVTEEDTFVVLANSEKEAKQIIFDEYFEEKVDVQEIESCDIKKGILVHYDCEDFYFN